MKTRWKLLSIFSVILLTTILFNACKKDNSLQGTIPAGMQKVSLFLTDGPGFFDSVLIDIKSVSVMVDTCDRSDSTHGGRGCHHDGWDDDNNQGGDHDGDHNGDHDGDHDVNHHSVPDSCKVWTDLQITPGVYNLLDLRNGLDTLLASGLVPQGVIKYIKIELGPNNSLVKDSVNYPLNLPPNHSTIVIKLKGNEWDLAGPGHLQLWLDFDVMRSIIRLSDNQFYLKPVIYLYAVRVTGSIQGIVKPRDAFPVISVYNDKDTAYALPNWEGEFKVRGLSDGEYNVFINASNGYKDTTITGVSVTAGQVVKLNPLELHK
ncbi:MAG: hypothetical protein C5B52_11925 [Bacteroidetes bacterium]|nr:MAG: hypothetical protein C5B52_11925 [Bacteroidota bacterium]